MSGMDTFPDAVMTATPVELSCEVVPDAVITGVEVIDSVLKVVMSASTLPFPTTKFALFTYFARAERTESVRFIVTEPPDVPVIVSSAMYVELSARRSIVIDATFPLIE